MSHACFNEQDAKEYLEEYKLKEIVHKYAEFITFPIYLDVERTQEKKDEPKKEEEEVENVDDSDDSEEEEEEEEEEKSDSASSDSTPLKKLESTLLNDVKPIWVRKPADITRDEYK